MHDVGLESPKGFMGIAVITTDSVTTHLLALAAYRRVFVQPLAHTLLRHHAHNTQLVCGAPITIQPHDVPGDAPDVLPICVEELPPS